jgi:hypothetical protein
MRLVLTMLIMLDAALTYIGVAFLGAHEVVLTFVNQVPELMWPFAFAKTVAVLYLCKKAEKYAWVRYLLYFAVFIHVVAVANNAYLLLWRLPLRATG